MTIPSGMLKWAPQTKGTIKRALSFVFGNVTKILVAIHAQATTKQEKRVLVLSGQVTHTLPRLNKSRLVIEALLERPEPVQNPVH